MIFEGIVPTHTSNLLQFFAEQVAKIKTIFILTNILPNSSKPISGLYVHQIGHYNPSVRIIDFVSNFINKWLELHFKVESERKIFFFEFLSEIF